MDSGQLKVFFVQNPLRRPCPIGTGISIYPDQLVHGIGLKCSSNHMECLGNGGHFAGHRVVWLHVHFHHLPPYVLVTASPSFPPPVRSHA